MKNGQVWCSRLRSTADGDTKVRGESFAFNSASYEGDELRRPKAATWQEVRISCTPLVSRAVDNKGSLFNLGQRQIRMRVILNAP